MNLILLLSALLSALSGGAGVRAAQAPTALSGTAISAAKATVAVRLQVASRPLQGLPTLGDLTVSAVRDFALTAAVPAFASRRRE